MTTSTYQHWFVAVLIAFLSIWTQAAEVAGWGDNSSGQIQIPAGLSNVVAVSAGGSHSLALQLDGQVVAWGNNDYGQTNVPPDLTNVVAIASGTFHNLALRDDGLVVAWGGDFSGQADVPPGLTDVVAIACGAFHSLALRTNGQVVAWGEDFDGQIQVPPGLSNVVAIAGGAGHSLALRAGGQVVAWGDNSAGQSSVPDDLDHVVAIAAGESHSLALQFNGEVKGWGNTVVPSSLGSAIAIGAGYYSVALKPSGDLVAWQADGSAPANGPENLTDMATMAVGEAHGIALKASPYQITGPLLIGPRTYLGTVNRSFSALLATRHGVNSYKAAGLPPGLILDHMSGWITGLPSKEGRYEVALSLANSAGTNEFNISFDINLPIPAIRNRDIEVAGVASTVHLLVLADNEVDKFEVDGLPAGLTLDANTGLISGSPLSMGDYPLTLIASNRFGIGTREITLRVAEVVGWGRNNFGQTVVPAGLSGIVAVAGGYGHSLALRSDGRVSAWGWNYYGQTDVPPGLDHVISIATGGNHSLALQANGLVSAWGANWSGQIDVPADLADVVAIAGGLDHSLALRSDGQVMAWGWNDDGQTDVPADLTNGVAIAAGALHSLALTSQGQVIAWGGNEDGQTNVPSTLTNVVAIAAGDYHSLALQWDGQVVAWGSNLHGQTNVPSALSNVVAIAARGEQSLALTSDRKIVAWGWNGYGQTNVPPDLTNAVVIASGRFHGLALLPSRQLIYTNSSVHLWNPATLVAPHQEGASAFLEWYLEDTQVEGATNRQLVLSSIQPGQEGHYVAISPFEFGPVTNAALDIQLVVAAVQKRLVFYNNSSWDGNDATANASDDNAIAPDKQALLPGQVAAFANYTSYSRGLNGIMIDVTNLPATPTSADFIFKVGNDNNPASWSDLATAPAISVRPGAGIGGSDRLTLIWPDKTIEKQWLQVSMMATPNTSLAQPDVFYFGNAIGEAGNSAVEAKVDLLDQQLPRVNPRTTFNPAPLSFAYDYNRDKKVDLLDQQIARLHGTTTFNALKLIDLRKMGANFGGALSSTIESVRLLPAMPKDLGTSDPSALAALPELSGEHVNLPAAGGQLQMFRSVQGDLVLESAGRFSSPCQLEFCESLELNSWRPILADPEWVEIRSCWRWVLPASSNKTQKFFRTIR